MSDKKGPGRPAHVPSDTTRRQVEMLKGLLLKDTEIAAVIGISDETLRKHYADELANGKAKVVAQVGNSLVKKALSDRPDAVNAAKFYLERAGQWNQRVDVHTNALDGMNDEQLESHVKRLIRELALDEGEATGGSVEPDAGSPGAKPH